MRPSQIATNVDAWKLADEMIRMGMRPPLVNAATRLPITALRDMWQQTHKRRPPSGLLPDNCLGLIRRRRHAIQASLFATTYFLRGGQNIFETADNRTIIQAYQEFQDMLAQLDMELLLDFTVVWYIARDLRLGTVELKYCRQCRAHHLYSLQSDLLRQCPYCDIHRHPDRLKKTRKTRTEQRPNA